ncbi:FadR/GntR family transcriptional regulator [Chitinophaga rhizophila]|uniref:FadR family transcriptional regulator n=1 Tax=Chitinophaga rhizophila TaxID=2866212 RepID=A0ABS7GKT5_9BACT|nr:FadR/GntR family transcriptional regulator [Chitinophaga rhizophila]MBW8687795.1 FadR family transcriptional regulator [Chitinophaga rhizophila]
MTKPIKLADKVIVELQQHISLGKYKEGDLIPPEPVLMEQFGVGRSTIREAIKTLANAGILKVQQGAGTFVCAPPVKTEPLDQRLRRAGIQEVNHVRQLLEVEIVQLAVIHRQQGDLEAMERLLQERWEAINAGDYATCADADIRFHKAIAGASHNSVLADLYQTFSNVIMGSFHKREAPHVAQFQRTHDLHVQLASAIRHQQSDLAVKTVRAILENNF